MNTILKNIRKVIVLFILSIVLVSFNNDDPKLDFVEKVYSHTDRSLYFPGETVWFKAYVVNTSNTISAISEMMYADLISPKGTVVKTLRLPIQNGYSYGDFTINEDWVGGIYTLKLYTNWMRNYGDDHFFTKEITVQKVVQPNLLMQLKFEKEGYGKSSEVIANIEVKDLKNQPLADTEITAALMIDGKTYSSKKLKTNAAGKSSPKFKLPKDLNTTDVLLNILVPYKGSTESISRSVPVILDNLDVQFFPESGEIIAGTTNIIAFKALNEYGKPADVSGEILDSQGNKIVTFNSFHDGMGGFELNPVFGEKYYAQLTKPFVSEKQISLPRVHEKGLRFSLKEENNQVLVSLHSTTKEALQLTVTNESGELFTKEIAASEKTITVDTNTFPAGITKFFLSNESKSSIAERLLFINYNKQLDVDIQIEKEIYNTREKVTVKVLTKDEKGMPVSSNLSVAVADNKLVSFADDKQDNILSYLLVSSELKGKIHKPVFYFDKKEPKAKKALDYVMLTHGWRRHITNNNVSFITAKHQPEQLAIQHGAVVDSKGNPKKAHLLLFNSEDQKVLDFDTNDKGEFSFKLSKGYRFTLVAYTDDNSNLYIHKKSKNNGYASKPENKQGIPNENAVEGFFGVKKPNQKPIKKEAKASIALEDDSAALDEVVIVGYGTTKKSNLTGSIVTVRASELGTNENLASALQGKAAGVVITNTSGTPDSDTKINIRGYSSISGNNQPLFIVDGVAVELNGGIHIDTDKISSVSVLKDLAATSLYGSRASNGVVIVTTKNQNNRYYNKKKLNNRKYNNYAFTSFYNYTGNSLDVAREFYMPVYEGENLPEERTDFRSTIYWNPIVQTDINGEASFEFYNSDAITSFKITTEGIGYNGLLGRQEKEYSTKKLLSIDFKLPNYMSLNDVITLPITLINESDETQFSTLELDLPENLSLIGAYDTTITLAPNTTVVKNVKVIAKTKADAIPIRARIKSEKYQDIVYKKVTILSPFFPIETSISGVKTSAFDFDVTTAVPNSVSAEFTLYTDILGDVTNGIESMIRQPYGCFEQVSSSTYPNILILKYLREIGKSKPRIERRAKKYIKDGYHRMAAYETKENGFEWYGGTPPHEALSAYGLMQFKEMEAVFDGVDQKMVQRTIDWLLSRRDNKGGFHQNKGKYGFSSAPKDVNNAYIVYALSESGLTRDYEKEYKAVYFNALDSLDTYKLALTALTSHNLKKTSEYENLMSYITSYIKKDGFEKLPVNNTITRSYGNAKNIETTAFVLLALLRDYEANELLVKEGIEHLLQKRRYGRFGSTQSTAMALKALITYAKIQKDKIIEKDDMVELHLNGKVIAQNLNIKNDGKIKIDSLEKYIKDGKQTIQVKFSNPKISFPYNLNIKWDSNLPSSSENCKVTIKTSITPEAYKVGDIVRMKVAVKNVKTNGLPMVTAIIGIPSGASVQPWQLKEILEQNKVAYYEIFDNYLVFYWREMGPQETKVINLDLKAEIAGNYIAPASCVYLYYGDEDKHWIKGNELTILE